MALWLELMHGHLIIEAEEGAFPIWAGELLISRGGTPRLHFMRMEPLALWNGGNSLAEQRERCGR